MKRRSLPVAAALVAAAALLTTACSGGGGNSKADDAIPGADTRGTQASPSPSADTSDEPHRPDITLPGDVKDVFEGWHTGNPTNDAILADAGRAQTATNYAIIKGNPDEPALAFYRQGNALVGGAKWVKSFVDAGITYTGTVRYFNPDVIIYSKTSAGVTFCTDETKAFNKDTKTQKVDRTPPDSDSYVYYNTHLKRNKDGVWQTTELVSDRGNAKCTP
ncbi:hypothetical protein [Streptomyces sp. 6-11-2]|uniref:hypothetical protein n=1 Tax=Streptomyces sp. 6-11-2 TaxID=2585753 RepID=UPI0011754834|nr:hypothetical protein [Streptomyces sp. 6-11-2]GED85474.1 lipoprotein [Streptomyces sp. 6-11-2]